MFCTVEEVASPSFLQSVVAHFGFTDFSLRFRELSVTLNNPNMLTVFTLRSGLFQSKWTVSGEKCLKRYLKSVCN